MFDITSSKLLLLGIVALLVIGPKDFPALMRTIGKYMWIIRGHAREFRAQFDDAMRESELEQLKKDVENVAKDTEATFQATGRSVEQTLDDARRDIDTSVQTANTPALDPIAHDANGLPIAPPEPAPEPASEPSQQALSGPAPEQPTPTASEETPQQLAEQPRPTEKSGA